MEDKVNKVDKSKKVVMWTYAILLSMLLIVLLMAHFGLLEPIDPRDWDFSE